jgi:hypothetical protein
MKKKSIIIVITLLLLTPTFALAQTPMQAQAPTSTQQTQQTQQAAPSFTDVPQTQGNYVAIMYLASRGILKGYSDGTFKPDQLVNRAEALKVILQGADVQVPATATTTSFSDVKVSDWFAVFIEKAKELGIVSGNPDGTFAPGRNVARADYLKMLLMANGFKPETWLGKQLYNDVPADAWFTPYMNYAGQAGLVTKDANNNLYPSKELTRGEVAQILYVLTVIRNGTDTQFLLSQAQSQIFQIDVYVNSNQLSFAKSASQFAVDTTQQALVNTPADNIVLGAAKIARAYDYLVNAYISAVGNKAADAKSWANQAITKATEGWQANNAVQPIAKHIKDLANAILAQLPA